MGLSIDGRNPPALAASTCSRRDTTLSTLVGNTISELEVAIAAANNQTGLVSRSCRLLKQFSAWAYCDHQHHVQWCHALVQYPTVHHKDDCGNSYRSGETKVHKWPSVLWSDAKWFQIIAMLSNGIVALWGAYRKSDIFSFLPILRPALCRFVFQLQEIYEYKPILNVYKLIIHHIAWTGMDQNVSEFQWYVGWILR